MAAFLSFHADSNINSTIGISTGDREFSGFQPRVATALWLYPALKLLSVVSSVDDFLPRAEDRIALLSEAAFEESAGLLTPTLLPFTLALLLFSEWVPVRLTLDVDEVPVVLLMSSLTWNNFE